MSRVDRDSNDQIIQNLTPVLTQAIITTSTTAALSAAVSTTTSLVEIYSPVDCFYAVGAAPVAVTTPGTSGIRLRADSPRVIKVTPGHKVSFILTSGTSTAEVTEF